MAARAKIPLPDVALADCGAILGTRGAGKSGAGRVILERELRAGHRSCVIDPKGDWYGIRLTKRGAPSKFDVPIFGGDHGDADIKDDMGARIGEMVATSGSSCIIDLSHFSRKGMLRFMAAFAEALFQHNRQPLTLLVDEADQLAPQRVASEVARLLHFMEALVRQGRQRGIFMWMLTQRPAVINKNVLGMAQTLVAMKMMLPHDRKAIREWMDAHDPAAAQKVETDLAKLTVGQAWAWCPGAEFLEKVQFPLFETYDSGRTPRHGEKVDNITLPKLDVAAIAAMLKGEDDTPDELAISREQLAAARQRMSEQLVQIRRLEGEVAAARAREDAYLEIILGVQNVIGAAIGSARIEPIAAGVDPEEFVMVLESDGVVRPHRRNGDARSLIAATRARMRAAKPSAGENGNG